MSNKRDSYIISRPSAAAELSTMLLDYKKFSCNEGSNSGESCRNIAMIVAPGLCGKTTFLLNDAKQMVVNGRNFENPYKDNGYKGFYKWVYVPFDIKGATDSKAMFLYKVCREMKRQGYSSPVLEASLKRYSVLTNKSLSNRFADFASVLNNAMRIVESATDAADYAYKLIEFVRDQNPDFLPDIDLGVEAILGMIEGAISTAESVVSITSGGVFVLRITIKAVALAADAASKKYECSFDISPMFNNMGIDSVERTMESAITSTFGNEIGNEGRPCIVIDGVEGLMGYDGPDDRVAWLERICSKNDAFFIISGRRRLRNLPSAKTQDIDLGTVSKDEFKILLGNPAVLSRQDEHIYKAAADLPGVLAIYATGRIDGILSKEDRRGIANTAKYVFGKKGIFRWKRMPIVQYNQIAQRGGLVKKLAAKYQEEMEQNKKGHLWQLVAALSWIPEWNAVQLMGVLSAFEAHALYINELYSLPFIQEAIPETSTFRIHPVMSACFRDACSEELRASLISNFEELLNTGSMKKCAIQTLLNLHLRGINDCISILETSDGEKKDKSLYFEEDLNNFEDMQITFDSIANQTIILATIDTLAKEKAAKELADHLCGMVSLMIEWAVTVRNEDPETSLSIITLADNLSRSVAFQIAPRLKALKESDAILLYASALRQEGAILSDHYRMKSDVCFHIKALALEIEALRAVLGVEGRRWDSVLKGKNASVFVDCINSVAMSCYRLKRYDLALPLISVAYGIIDFDKKHAVGKSVETRIRNNFAAIRYGFLADCVEPRSINGVSWPMPVADSNNAERDNDNGRKCDTRIIPCFVSPFRDGLLEEMINEGREKTRNLFMPGNDMAWKSAFNYISCLMLSDEHIDEACDAIRRCEDNINAEKQGKSDYMLRCLTIKSRILIKMALKDTQNKKKYLDEAREAAEKANGLAVDILGSMHVDVLKNKKLINEINEYVKAPDSIEFGKTEKGEYREASIVRIPATTVAGNIVRGDMVFLEDVFSLSQKDLEKKFHAVFKSELGVLKQLLPEAFVNQITE